MWKVGLGSPKRKIDKEVSWHSRNVSPQVHGVTWSKRESKAIAGTMKWYGRINSQEVHEHKKEKHGLGETMRAFAQATPSPKKGWKARNMSSKTHTSFTPQEINTNQNVQHNQTNMEEAEMVWRPERNKFRRSGACTKGEGTTYLYPTNTWEVGHGSRYSEGVVWWWGERGGLF